MIGTIGHLGSWCCPIQRKGSEEEEQACGRDYEFNVGHTQVSTEMLSTAEAPKEHLMINTGERS